MPKSISIAFFCILSFTSFSQKEKKERFPTYFGIIASPVIPNNFIGELHTEMSDQSGTMTADFRAKCGFTFGGTIRIGLTRNISLETGLAQVRRIYRAAVSLPDYSISVDKKLSFVNYDLPINALFYVRMTDKWLMDASLGVSVVHYPSDTQDSIFPAAKKTIFIQGRRTERTYFAFNAGIGFEYRTEKAGTFFLGFGAKVPFKQPLFGVSIFREEGTFKQSAYKPISAGYFTVDFKYFIPTPKKKKNISNKPLIE